MGQNIHPGNAGLPFGLPVSTIATYSVAVAVLLQVAGFVITTQHYSRAGVGARAIPLHLTLAAGFSFVVITGFYLYVGAATATMAKSVGSWSDAQEVLLYGVSFTGFFYIVLVMFLLRWPGTGLYCALCGLVGGVVGRVGVPSYWPTFSADRLVIPDLARFIIPLLVALWLFARLVYPNLSRALGGGAPLPVIIKLAPEYEDFIPAGAEVYEVHSTPEFMYLELVFHPDHPGAKAPGDGESIAGPLAAPPRRYLQVPAGAVRCIERLHPFVSSPPVHGVVSTIQTQREPPK